MFDRGTQGADAGGEERAEESTQFFLEMPEPCSKLESTEFAGRGWCQGAASL